jgi:hypothetical protein
MGSTRARSTWRTGDGTAHRMATVARAARRVGPGVLALAVLALAGCGSEVAGGGPPALHIGTGSATTRDAAVPAVLGVTTGAGAATDPYPLRGILPTGPASAVVHRYVEGRVPAATVTALAAVLGIAAPPTRHAFGWAATSAAGTLHVRDGGGWWSFMRAGDACPEYAVDVDSADAATALVGCALAVPPTTEVAPCPATSTSVGTTIACPGTSAGTTPGTTTGRAGADLPDAVALAAARPVLDAAGVTSAGATLLEPSGPVRDVAVDPVVGGLPTTGVRTVVSVDLHGVRGAPASSRPRRPGRPTRSSRRPRRWTGCAQRPVRSRRSPARRAGSARARARGPSRAPPSAWHCATTRAPPCWCRRGSSPSRGRPSRCRSSRCATSTSLSRPRSARPRAAASPVSPQRPARAAAQEARPGARTRHRRSATARATDPPATAKGRTLAGAALRQVVSGARRRTRGRFS